jgi:hypothetical protein
MNQVYADALLVFNNARAYNKATEDVAYMANVVQEVWQALWRKALLPELAKEAAAARREEEGLR